MYQKIIYLLLLAGSLSGRACAQSWGDSPGCMKFGIGWNYSGYVDRNNLHALSEYLNSIRNINNHYRTKEIDLAKFGHGIAFNAGYENDHFSLFAQWNNMSYRDNIQYYRYGSDGLKYEFDEAFKLKYNQLVASGAIGFRYIKVGVQLDIINKHKVYYNSQDNWHKADSELGFGGGIFLEINPVRFIKIKPYIQTRFGRGDYSVYYNATNSYNFSIGRGATFGVITFLEIPRCD